MQPLVGPVGPVGGAMGPMRGQGGTTPAQRRRRTVLVGLLGAAGITLVMAAFSGGNVVFLGLQGATDVLLGAYVYLLLQLKTRQSTRRSPQLRPAEPAGPRRHLRPVPAFGDLTPVPDRPSRSGAPPPSDRHSVEPDVRASCAPRATPRTRSSRPATTRAS